MSVYSYARYSFRVFSFFKFMILKTTKHLFLVLLFLQTVSIWSHPIDIEQARQIAQKSGLLAPSTIGQVQSKSHQRVKAEKQLDLVYALNDAAETPLLYVFSPTSKQGFVVVAADDAVDPIIGYSADHRFSNSAMPPQLRAILQTAGRHISHIATQTHHKIKETDNPTSQRLPIEPLLKDICWGQGYPYWSKTPNIKGYQAPTGCVATALAQIMYLHRHPVRATGTSLYSFSNFFKPGENVDLDALGDIQWDKMRSSYKNNVYYSEEETQAIGNFMLAVGAACNMKYDPNMSGATGVDALKALHKHFNYPKAQLIRRMNRTVKEWEDIIYRELSGGRPVYMDGASGEIGHAFVCDGVDERGLYHINWGWDGMANGYFSFSFLAPPFYGTGSKDRDVYVGELQAIVGIASPDNAPEPLNTWDILAKGLEKSNDYREDHYHFDIRCVRLAGYEQIEADFSLGIRVDGKLQNVGYSTAWTIKKDLIYSRVDATINSSLVPEGEHVLIPIYSSRGKNDWKEIPTGRYFKYAVTVNKKGNELTVKDDKSPIRLVTSTVRNVAFSGVNNSLTFRVRNIGEAVYSSGVSVFFQSQEPQAGTTVDAASVAKKTIYVHLEPGEERDYMIDYFPNTTKDFYAALTYDPTNGLSDETNIIPTTLLPAHHFVVKNAWVHNGNLSPEFTEDQYIVAQNEQLRTTIRVKANESPIYDYSLSQLRLFVWQTGNGVRYKFPQFEVMLKKGQSREYFFDGYLNLPAGEYQLKLTRYEVNNNKIEYHTIKEAPLRVLDANQSDVVKENGIVYQCSTGANAVQEAYIIDASEANGEVVIPEKVKFNGQDYVVKGFKKDGAFKDNTKITSVSFPDGFGAVASFTFKGCSRLKAVRFSKNSDRIGQEAFAQTALTEALLPESVKEIDYETFGGCKSLIKVSFPSKLEKLDEAALQTCPQLTQAEFRSEKSPVCDGKETKPVSALLDKATVSSVKVYLRKDANGFETGKHTAEKKLKMEKLTVTDAGYSTIEMPFNCFMPNELQLSKVTVKGNNIDATTLQADVAATGNCFLVKANSAEYELVETVLGTPTQMDLEDNELKGTRNKSNQLTEKSNTHYYILGKLDNVVGFYWQSGTQGKTLNNTPGKCYLEIMNANHVQGFRLDGTILTGIEITSSPKEHTPIYDLSGRRVTDAAKGIYILNGQKYIR